MEEGKDITIVLKDVKVPKEWDEFSTEKQKIYLKIWIGLYLHSVQIK